MKPFEVLYNYVQSIEPIPKEIWDSLKSIFSLIELKTGEVYIEKGKIHDSWTFIASGALHLHTSVQKKESTFNLFAENRFFADTVSLFENKPSQYTLSAILDSTIIVVKNSDYENLCKESKLLNRFGRKQYEIFLMQAMERMQSAMFDTTEEKYTKLLKRMPTVVNKIPDKYIASYLNVTPQSLSRIKRNIV